MTSNYIFPAPFLLGLEVAHMRAALSRMMLICSLVKMLPKRISWNWLRKVSSSSTNSIASSSENRLDILLIISSYLMTVYCVANLTEIFLDKWVKQKDTFAHVTATPINSYFIVIIFKFHNLVWTITIQFHNPVEPEIMYYTILFR